MCSVHASIEMYKQCMHAWLHAVHKQSHYAYCTVHNQSHYAYCTVHNQSHNAYCTAHAAEGTLQVLCTVPCVWWYDHPSIHPSLHVSVRDIPETGWCQPSTSPLFPFSPLPLFLSRLLPFSSLRHSHLWLLIPHFRAGTEKQTSCLARCHISQRNKAVFVRVLAVYST